MTFIPPDSPLRNPPASLPDEQKVALDGLRYAADMLDLAAVRLYEDLIEVSRHPREEKLPDGSFTRCFADTWSLIDNFWRLNLLLIRVPGLKRTPDVVVDLKAIRKIEAFRHGFQHLDGQVRKCAVDHLPLLGVLSWAYFPNGGQQTGWLFAMVPGAARPGTAPFVNPLGKHLNAPVDFVTLTAFGEEIELTALLRRVAGLLARLDAGLRVSATGTPGGGADLLMSAEIVPGTASANATDAVQMV